MIRLRLVLILLFSIHFTNAQSLEGFVTDFKTTQPIPYASVVLKSVGGKFLIGVTTNEKGKYEIQYKSGTYKLSVSFLGFLEYLSPITIKRKTTFNIKLNENTTDLDEITVTAEKTRTTQLIDKKVINVGKDLLASGGNAATVLSQLSEVNADETGNISLRGSQNINLLINGKPTALSSAEVLQQIPANDIVKIEIITSPSAKYQANGMTGIINIITKKKVQKGIVLSINSKTSTLLDYGAGINFSYGKNKVNYRFGASYNTRIFKRKNTEERTGTFPYTQKSNFDYDGLVQKINTGLDWFPNKKNEFSTDISYVNSTHTMTNNSDFLRNGTAFSQESIGVHVHKRLKYNVNYRHLFDKENHFLEIDAQISDHTNALNGYFNPIIAIQNNESKDTSITYNFAIDYTKKVNETLSFEAGYLFYNSVLNSSSYTKINSNQLNNTGNFENKQHTQAIYSLLKFYLKKWSFQTGLRGEFYYRNANFNSNNASIKNEYNNLFPSLHINYKYAKNSNFNFGYNRRTSRPSLYQIDPIDIQMNEFLIQRGNQNLLPEFSHNFEISNSYKKDKLDIISTVFYRLKESIIISNTTLDNNGITVFSYSNGGRSNGYGAELSVSYDFTKWISTDFSTNYNFEKLQEQTNLYGNDYQKSIFLSLRNQIKISKRLKLDVSWNYDAPRKNFFTNYEFRHRVNFGMRYRILQDKGSVNIRVTNLLDSDKFVGKNIGNTFVRKFTRNSIARVITMSFTYRFSKDNLKKRNRKNRDYL